MIKHYFLGLFLTIQAVSGWAQSSPYELKTAREVRLLGAGAIAEMASLVINSNLQPLTAAEVATRNRSVVNGFDRGATYNWSTSADKLSTATMGGTFAAAGLVAIGSQPTRSDLKTIGFMYVETLLLVNGINNSIKTMSGRDRPFVYNPDAPLAEKLDKDARKSFLSGHATNAFASAVFASEVFRHYFPDSKLKPVVWVGTLGLATATAYLRYDAGKHYPSDLLGGAAFGALVGWAIPKLHQVKDPQSAWRRLEVQPWSSGQASGVFVRLSVYSH